LGKRDVGLVRPADASELGGECADRSVASEQRRNEVADVKPVPKVFVRTRK